MLTSSRVRLRPLGWGSTALLAATLLVGAGPAVESSSLGVHAAPEVAASSDSGGAYSALTPTRLLDTRSSNPLGPGQSLNLNVVAGAVASDATAVALNVTVTGTTASGFLSAYPSGGGRPGVSNLNWVRGETVANLVIVPVGAGGDVTFYNAAGTAQVVVDLEGFFGPAASTAGSYVPLAPARVTDTRTGSGFPNQGQPLGPGGSLAVELAGAGGIPATGAAAALVNVTVTDTSAAGFLTIYPSGDPLPTASNLNWSQGETVANRVLVPVGPSGQVTLYNSAGTTEVAVDVDGYFTNGSSAPNDASLFTAMAPVRVLDTRKTGAPLGAGGAFQLSLAGTDGIAGDATAVVTNVTAVDTTAASYLTVYPGGTPPEASDLNWTAGQVVPNLTVATLSGSGAISVYNHAGSAGVVVDAFGYFTPPSQTTSTGSVVFSANWSGYEYGAGPFSSVAGTFNVPDLETTSTATDAAEWVGIDGADNSDLIQAGVGEEYDPGTNTVQIQAWWEVLPAPETPITSVAVVPGDSITVQIRQLSGTQWTIALTNNTTGRSFSTSPVYAGPGASAEWVVEAPTVDPGGQSTLGAYSPEVNFTGITAVGPTPTVTEVVMEQDGAIVSVPSAISSGAFNIAYGSTVPAAP
jgi:hypothetical protein